MDGEGVAYEWRCWRCGKVIKAPNEVRLEHEKYEHVLEHLRGEGGGREDVP
ncbi:MAG: hypothetical protein QXM08_04005 [Thermofilaceae archaeon]